VIPENVVVFECQASFPVVEYIEFRVCLTPREMYMDFIERGASIHTTFAEIGEQFYVIAIPFTDVRLLHVYLNAVNDMFPIYLNDAGLKAVHKCIAPDHVIEGLNRYD